MVRKSFVFRVDALASVVVYIQSKFPPLVEAKLRRMSALAIPAKPNASTQKIATLFIPTRSSAKQNVLGVLYHEYHRDRLFSVFSRKQINPEIFPKVVDE